jgi:hypothetical protein
MTFKSAMKNVDRSWSSWIGRKSLKEESIHETIVCLGHVLQHHFVLGFLQIVCLEPTTLLPAKLVTSVYLSGFWSSRIKQCED